MPSHLLTPGLQLFYDLVHDLNSTLELDRVLERVINQVNEFLHIDATSVSLLDSESQELVIMMTVGQVTDPKPGLRLPPYAGVAGWVARHGEPLLIPDAQQDQRFFPGVDQLTGFTTRSMLSVPLRIQERCIGVIQAISGVYDAFSRADLVYLVTLADVAALAIENARLYTTELGLRQRTQRFQDISNVLSTSLGEERVVQSALEILPQIVRCERAVVITCQQRARFVPAAEHSIEAVQESIDSLEVHAAWGFDDRSAVIGLQLPTTEASLYRQVCVSQRPISIADVAQDDRYVQLPGASIDHAWLGVPMVLDGKTIGQVVLSRDQVQRFSAQEVESVQVFARQVAGALTRDRLYRETRARADELEIVKEVMAAIVSVTELHDLLQQIAECLLDLMRLDGIGVSLFDPESDVWTSRFQVRLSPGLAQALTCEGTPTGTIGQKAILSGHTILVTLGNAGDPSSGMGAIVPLVVQGTPVGLLALERQESGRILSRHMALLDIVGAQLAIAVDRAQSRQDR